jgi:hypothetical protein
LNSSFLLPLRLWLWLPAGLDACGVRACGMRHAGMRALHAEPLI